MLAASETISNRIHLVTVIAALRQRGGMCVITVSQKAQTLANTRCVEILSFVILPGVLQTFALDQLPRRAITHELKKCDLSTRTQREFVAFPSASKLDSGGAGRGQHSFSTKSRLWLKRSARFRQKVASGLSETFVFDEKLPLA